MVWHPTFQKLPKLLTFLNTQTIQNPLVLTHREGLSPSGTSPISLLSGVEWRFFGNLASSLVPGFLTSQNHSPQGCEQNCDSLGRSASCRKSVSHRTEMLPNVLRPRSRQVKAHTEFPSQFLEAVQRGPAPPLEPQMRSLLTSSAVSDTFPVIPINPIIAFLSSEFIMSALMLYLAVFYSIPILSFERESQIKSRSG